MTDHPDPAHEHLIKWCIEQRETLIAQRSALSEGRLSIRENRGAGWIDLTSESIETIRRNIADIDEILSDFNIHNF